MKTSEELELEKRSLVAQIELIDCQLENLSFDKKKLEQLVGRYFKSDNNYMHVTDVWGKEIVFKNIVVEKDWIYFTNCSNTVRFINNSYIPLTFYSGDSYVEIDKEEFDDLMEVYVKTKASYELHQKYCKELIESVKK